VAGTGTLGKLADTDTVLTLNVSVFNLYGTVPVPFFCQIWVSPADPDIYSEFKIPPLFDQKGLEI